MSHALTHLESEWARWRKAIRARERAKARDAAPTVIELWQRSVDRHHANIDHLVDVVMRENHASDAAR